MLKFYFGLDQTIIVQLKLKGDFSSGLLSIFFYSWFHLEGRHFKKTNKKALTNGATKPFQLLFLIVNVDKTAN